MKKISCVLAALATIAVAAPTVASAEGFSFRVGRFWRPFLTSMLSTLFRIEIGIETSESNSRRRSFWKARLAVEKPSPLNDW